MHGQSYHEPYRFPAGLLALLVHGVFFTLLYFGFNWQSRLPEVMRVELWSLPEAVEAVAEAPTAAELPPSPAPLKPVPVPPLAAPPRPQPTPEIALRDKKPKAQKAAEEAALAEQKRREAALEAQREQERLEEARRQREAAEQQARAEEERRRLAEQQAREQRRQLAEKRMREEVRIRAEQERIRQEVESAMRAEVERYKERIQNKIRRNIVMPPDVPEHAEAKFYVRLLPGGEVVDVVLEQSSGNAAYDSAAERAIYKSRPLPVPPDPELERLFRELHLYVRP